MPMGHILNEGVTPVGSNECVLMLCGTIQVRVEAGVFRPAMEIYCLDEVKPDSRPMCERCMEIAGL